MSKKLIHQLSVEDLLESLASEDENSETDIEFDSPVLSFIQAFEIVEGEQKVSDIVLYELFRLWHRRGAWTKKTFNNQLGKYIPSVQPNRRFYTVDKTTLEIAKKAQEIINKRKRDKRKSVTWQKHFTQFIEENELEKGNMAYVEGDILYYVYNRWADKYNKKCCTSQNTFYDIMSLHFDRSNQVLINTDLTCFKVSRNITKLITKEEIERWRKGRKIKHEKSTREKYNKEFRGKVLYGEKKEQKSRRPSKRTKKGVHSKE